MSDKILVLDDELNFAEMLHELLVEKGFDAEISTRPAEALKRLRDEDFALVLADYKMPEMNGAEFLVEARKRMPELPVIMISGLMNTPDLLKVANIGVTLVLEKPIDISDFFDQVRRFAEPESDHSVGDPAGEGHKGSMVSYPKPLAYFSDTSGLGRAFIQTAWDALHTHRQVVFGAPAGSELSLVAREIARFMGSEAGKPVCSFSIRDAVSEAGRKRLQKVALDADYASVMTIEVEDVDADGHLLREFLQATSCDIVLRDSAWFLIALRTSESVGGPLPADLTDAFRTLFPYYLRLAPLKDRISDAAVYFQRMLGARFGSHPNFEDGGPVLSKGALKFFLGYNWPGNYAELSGLISRIPGIPPNPIDSATLQDWVFSGFSASDPDPQSMSNLTLHNFLLRKQQEFLESLQRDEKDLRHIAASAGVELARLDPEQTAARQPLLYPELLDDLSFKDSQDSR